MFVKVVVVSVMIVENCSAFLWRLVVVKVVGHFDGCSDCDDVVHGKKKLS